MLYAHRNRTVCHGRGEEAPGVGGGGERTGGAGGVGGGVGGYREREPRSARSLFTHSSKLSFLPKHYL